ncbi:MAG: IS256 family transposase [Candidatus Margulisbacteria bacterium]|nr:IS256 family transposase [Candidatus Margulisiibacteriota bacterium]
MALNSPAIQKTETPKDLLTDVIKQGAQTLLAAAIGAEVDEFMQKYEEEKDKEGRQRFVRNGYLPERNIQTGIGNVPVKAPRVNDRNRQDDGIGFTSSIVPKYMRRSQSIEELLPLLYLNGVSSPNFKETLAPLLGENAKNLSPNVICSLKATWTQEQERWAKRDLSDKKYVYWWADGIYLKARMDDAKACVLVIIGVTETGEKELLTMQTGIRESKESWKDVLQDLQAQGLKIAPKLAMGDGALGFWGAMTEIFPTTQHQRCWFHKTGNVLNKLPKSLQGKAKVELREIWMQPTRKDANTLIKRFVNRYKAKYPKAASCLERDKEKLLAFYDFPAEHWIHLRTTNPIESVFATVRHRTYKGKGCYSRKTILAMVFKLCENAQKRWIRLKGANLLAKVMNGAQFIDGVIVDGEESIDSSDKEAA